MIRFHYLSVIFILLSLVACTENKELLDRQIFEESQKAYEYAYSGEFEIAINLINGLIQKDLNNPGLYLHLMTFKRMKYGFPQDIPNLNSEEYIQLDELESLGEKALSLFEAKHNPEDMTESEKRQRLNIAFALARMYFDYGVYEKAVEYYFAYYDVENYLSDPEYKFYTIQYAKALAKIGDIEEGDKLFLKLLDANGREKSAMQSYIYFTADHRSYDTAITMAKNHISEFGVSDRVLYSLCNLYEEKKLIEQAVDCYTKFLTYSESHEVFSEGLQLAQDYLSNKVN